MFFLLRMSFWIGLVCLLVQTSNDNHRLISSAEQTVNDFKGFCQRNPQVCEDARAMMTSFLSNLRSGAEKVQSWLVDQNKGSLDVATDLPEKPARRSARLDQPPPHVVTKYQDNLNSTDKQPYWRGPAF
jgi:hypothetical protein